MKITDPKALPQQYARPGAQAPKNGAPSAAPAGAEISLSGLGGKLATLESELSAAPAFDSARVEEIKQAIKDGSYKVDPERIADKLLADVASLLGRKH